MAQSIAHTLTNQDSLSASEPGYWHRRLSSTLGVIVFFASVIVGPGALHFGLFFGLTLDPDVERRQFATMGIFWLIQSRSEYVAWMMPDESSTPHLGSCPGFDGRRHGR